MTDNAKSMIFSNLAKAAEKQQNLDNAQSFTALSGQYAEGGDSSGDFKAFKESLVNSLGLDYPAINKQAEGLGDRGVLRALKWGEKVTTIQKSMTDRFLSKGEALLEGKDLYICEACGFIFLGTAVPDICPVCKAPASRFRKIK